MLFPTSLLPIYVKTGELAEHNGTRLLYLDVHITFQLMYVSDTQRCLGRCSIRQLFMCVCFLFCSVVLMNFVCGFVCLCLRARARACGGVVYVCVWGGGVYVCVCVLM